MKIDIVLLCDGISLLSYKRKERLKENLNVLIEI